MSKKRSPIWQYFDIAEDSRVVICRTCSDQISRGGGNTKTYNTTNLVYHLRTRHPEDFSKFKEVAASVAQQKDAASTSTASKQITLQESVEKSRKWDINDTKALVIHRKIGEMIAIDDQPFSIVSDTGFINLVKVLEPRYNIPSRKYFTETVIKKLFDDVKSIVAKEVTAISHLGLTTDIWSTDLNSCSLLSLTAHWLTSQFERRSATLHAQQFDGSHTGDAIGSTILQMLEEWNIKDKILLIIRDNAANMIKGLTDCGLPHYGCFAHTLQLVIHDAIFAQRVVIDLLATSRSIVGHFRRSNLAYTRPVA